MLKKTPLNSAHRMLNAKMVEFGGWEMPVQYTNVIDEHTATRTKAGLFDICHMGEFYISGKYAYEFLQKICVNDLDKLTDNKCQYSLLCNENGGTIDDCFVYQFSKQRYMMVTNASNTEKDFNWLEKNNDYTQEELDLEDASSKTAKIDLQGPASEKVLQNLADYDLSKLKRFYFVETKVNGIDCIVSRTGYTGENGFELYYDSNLAEKLWVSILSAGKAYGIKPIGLGARDTLRIESCYSLYGHELNDCIGPVEAGIGWVVPNNKQVDFIGKSVLIEQKEDGTGLVNVAFEMVDRAIAREHYKIFKDNREIGEVSSGTFSPTFRKPIGMCFVNKEFSEPNTEVEIDVRGKKFKAKIVKKPIYQYRG